MLDKDIDKARDSIRANLDLNRGWKEMIDEIIKQFLRDVAEIPTRKELLRWRNGNIEAYAIESAPGWFCALVDAAKKAVAAIGEDKP